ncbi:uncharacterized protein LOC135466953 [Liolophura sinensis]|uniref:uncharacterized protein LOC135466953 n=1 Tax=Liolophura sinensis TaxID=3198878 RepID=UPI0031589AA9
MKLLLPILATIAVWTAPSIGQPNPNPSTSSSSKASPPKSTLPVNPPNTGDTAVSTKVNPQKTSPGVGIFNAASNNPWGVPPPNQPPMPQVYQPWAVRPQLTPSWGPQPPPAQRMPLLMDIASMMDLLDSILFYEF